MAEIPEGCDRCPNRRSNGVTLFGWHIDPLEMLLHMAVVVVLGIPAARASMKPDYTIANAIEWMGALTGASTIVRLSPTDRINAYLNLTRKQS